MTSRRIRTHLAAYALAAAVAACAAPPARPPITASVPARPRPVPKPKPLDWFHRQLAAAHRARISHLPRGDTAGAQRAYDAVMLPVCGQVVKSGPAQYRARCQALMLHASNAAAAAAYNPPCDDDHDDSADTPAQITACSD